MEKFQDVLMNVGIKCSSNKYLKSISNSFTGFMPFTIIGAIGILWSNVLCNAETGLGALWSPIMTLEFLNPAFNAINFATIGCISIGIGFLVAMNIGEENGEESKFCGVLGVVAFISILNTSTSVYDSNNELISTVSGITSSDLGSNGLFTAMIISIVTVELFSLLRKVDALKIKMPSQVPAGIARSFEYLIPGFIAIAIISIVGLIVQLTTGSYLNNLIYSMIQKPLTYIGGSLPGIIVFELITLMLWAVGLHGENMTNGVFDPIVTALTLENMEYVKKGLDAPNIINSVFVRQFICTGGTGMVIGLSIALLLVAKRPENKAIGKVAIVSNLFNIGEVNMFGVPVVLNPTLVIPFILAPITSLLVGYGLTVIGFCPVLYLQIPWTMPPILYGLLASGGNIMAAISQAICIAVATLIYIPFVKIYEKQQAKLENNQD